MSVNLSARQFAQSNLAEMVAGVIERTEIDPGRLGLEVTESVLMDRADRPVETLLALKRLGVRLLLDDFGTGYSSLSYLKDFPIDVLKVDAPSSPGWARTWARTRSSPPWSPWPARSA